MSLGESHNGLGSREEGARDRGLGLGGRVCALQSVKFLNMPTDLIAVASNGDAAPGPHAERKKEEKKEEEKEDREEREELGEEWGDEGERRCYLLGQEHDSWEVREREAGEWPLWVEPNRKRYQH